LRAGALRFAIAATFTSLVAMAVRHRSSGQATTKTASTTHPSLLLGVTLLAAPYALTAWAVGQANPGVVALLFAFMPLAALLMSGEGPSAAIQALVVGIAGVGVLVARSLPVSLDQARGAVLVAIAVGLGAFSLVYAQRRLATMNLPASVAIQCAVAAVALGGLSAVTEHGNPAPIDGSALASLLVLGIAGSGLGLLLMYWLLNRLAAWQVAALQWSATLVAVAESAWLLRVKPSAEMCAGAAMIAGATVWLLRGNERQAEAVTLQITNHTSDASSASESEVGSK
jgi:drug/metabolite transporter (DMT)-like permease